MKKGSPCQCIGPAFVLFVVAPFKMSNESQYVGFFFAIILITIVGRFLESIYTR